MIEPLVSGLAARREIKFVEFWFTTSLPLIKFVKSLIIMLNTLANYSLFIDEIMPKKSNTELQAKLSR